VTARVTFTLAATALAASFLSGCSSGGSSHASPLPATTTKPPVTACHRPHAAGLFPQSFTFQGTARTYLLYVPAAYNARSAAPVVFDFHGYGSNARQQFLYSNFRPEADRDGFLIVAPNGQGSPRHFNLTGEPGLQNDVQMVVALRDHIEATFCVDTRRVDSTGMSDGGGMTSLLACEMYTRFAAFAPVTAVAYRPSCSDDHPIAIAAFSGTADTVVPFEGGRVNCCGHPTIAAAPATMSAWAAHNRCDPRYHDRRIGTDVRERTWSGCEPGSAPVFYIIDGGGHTWPGSIALPGLGKTTQTIDATARIWRFFQVHPLR